jgi:hypothetical protein
MEISEKQLAANRANAAKSTGPKTPGGRRNSSRNATTHGLLANSILIEGESKPRFLQLIASLVNEFEPSTPSEHMLVETMAVARWRLRRIWTLEAVRINHEQRRQTGPDADENPPVRTNIALDKIAERANRENLSRNEARYDRQYHRAADRLRLMKREKQPRTHFSEENKEVIE